MAQAFDRLVAQSLDGTASVYCYEDSAVHTFRAAARIGVMRYYELPIVYWQTAQKLLRQEAERYPEWEPTLLATRDSDAKLERKSCELQLAAMKLLNRADVELIVLGTPLLPLAFYQRDYPGFVYEAVRPHRAVRQLMLTCDVLVLPSIVEGRAMVQMEALSCGLPIIVTPNAGAEDLIEQQRTGFLVPIRAPERLAEIIGWIADHPEWVDDVRPAVLEKARQSGWDRYTRKILAAVCRL